MEAAEDMDVLESPFQKGCGTPAVVETADLLQVADPFGNGGKL